MSHTIYSANGKVSHIHRRMLIYFLNKTRALLHTIGGKDEPNIASMQKSQRLPQHETNMHDCKGFVKIQILVLYPEPEARNKIY
jgi:hypothetical protein